MKVQLPLLVLGPAAAAVTLAGIHSCATRDMRAVAGLQSLAHPASDMFPFRGKVTAMAALGDSVAKGFAAGTRMGEPLPGRLVWRLFSHFGYSLERVRRFQAGGERESLGAVKDILTQEAESAYTGTVAFSHRSRIERHQGESLRAVNLAALHARTDAVVAQVDTLVASERSLAPSERTNYAVIQAGSNDFCGGVPPDASAANLREAMDRLLTFNPTMTILFVPVADIPAVRVAAPDDALGFVVDSAGFSTARRCGEIRKFIYSACRALSIPGMAAAPISDYNAAFRAVVSDESESHAEARIVYARSIANAPLSADLLGADCFHPGKRGQELLSRATWQDLRQPAEGANSPTSALSPAAAFR